MRGCYVDDCSGCGCGHPDAHPPCSHCECHGIDLEPCDKCGCLTCGCTDERDAMRTTAENYPWLLP